MNTRTTRFAVAAVVMLTAASVQAQSDSQKFTVTVPTTITITAPTDAVATHDETENNQTIDAAWTVVANDPDGVSISFSTDQAFTNTSDSDYKRDVKLDIALGSGNTGPAAWTFPTATDQTDYDAGTPDEIATVQAVSDDVGTATLDLTISFITDGYGTFAAGDYETTVTGTVTAN